MPDAILEYWLAQARDLAHRFDIEEFETSSEMWSWENFNGEIGSLRNRLGVGDRYVSLLGLKVDLQTGETFDQIKEKLVQTSRVIPFLYYYSQAQDRGIANEWVKFNSLRGSWACRYSFDEEQTSSLAGLFAKEEQKLVEGMKLIGAEPAEYDDASFIITFLPKVKVLLILERGDDEFPPDARLFYDQNSIYYQPHEMLGNISWFLTSRVHTAISTLNNSE